VGGPDQFHRGLTAEGLRQAEQLVAELVDLAPAVIVSSPYLRAVQTVEPTARAVGLPVRTIMALREWDSGLGPRPDFAVHYAASWDDPQAARPGGESLAQLSTRAMTALAALLAQHRDATVMIGSHGMFIARALVGLGIAVDWAFCRAMPMPAVYQLRFDHGQLHASGPGLPARQH
jgi:2,3-bisphosphoglycerate-dependent phosphoglycerate mutase